MASVLYLTFVVSIVVNHSSIGFVIVLKPSIYAGV